MPTRPDLLLKNIVRFFLSQCENGIAEIQMVKFIYLADLYTTRWTGRQATHARWQLHLHGPWSEEIKESLQSLQDSRELDITTLADGLLLKPLPTLEPPQQLPRELELTLENIWREWSGAAGGQIHALQQHVYNTAPVRYALDHHRKKLPAPLNLKREHKRFLAELEHAGQPS